MFSQSPTQTRPRRATQSDQPQSRPSILRNRSSYGPAIIHAVGGSLKRNTKANSTTVPPPIERTDNLQAKRGSDPGPLTLHQRAEDNSNPSKYFFAVPNTLSPNSYVCSFSFDSEDEHVGFGGGVFGVRLDQLPREAVCALKTTTVPRLIYKTITELSRRGMFAYK